MQLNWQLFAMKRNEPVVVEWINCGLIKRWKGIVSGGVLSLKRVEIVSRSYRREKPEGISHVVCSG